MAKLFGRAIINQITTVYPGGTAFVSEELVGTGEPQQVAHGLPFTPTKAIVLPSGLPGGSVWEYSVELDAAYAVVTATAGVTYRVFVWTGITSSSPLRLKDPNEVVWDLKVDAEGTIFTIQAETGALGTTEALLEGDDGSRWRLTVDADGVLTTTKIGSVISAAKLGKYAPSQIPEPSLSWKGTLISVWEAGMDEEVRYCRQKADGSFEWVIVAY